MKKLIYLMLAFCATMFTACSDDDKNDTPINGLEIPKFENPVTPGQTVTIKGEGFDEGSEIWFRAIATRATDNDDVKAEVTGVDANGITFIAPSVYGNQSILLKQDGREYKLGEMLFADQPEEPADVEILPKRIKRIIYHEADYGEDSYEYEYDADGRIILYKKGDDFDKYTYTENKITIKNDEVEYTFNLENGRIISYSWVDHYENECENATLKYDGNYLNKVNGTFKDEEEESTFTETFSFLNGNMTEYKCDYQDDGDYVNIVFTYGNQLNNLNIDLFCVFDLFDSGITETLTFGMMGKRSHYLPSSINISYPEWDDDEENIIETSYTTKLEYEMDGEYITKITLKDDDGDIAIYEIEYE